jgi:hypothetical protein
MRLRLPGDVKAWVAAQAKKNLRSLNAEVLAALKEKIAATGRSLATEPVAAALNNHQETIDADRT